MVNRNDEIVSSLRNKIEAIETKAKQIDTKEANDVKEKAVDILNRVTNKFIEASRNVLTNDEYEQGFQFVEKKSDELFESAMKKLEQLTPKKKEIVTQIEQEAIDEMDSFILSTIQKEKEDSSPSKEEKEYLQEEEKEEEPQDIPEIEIKAIKALKEWLSPGKDA